MTRVVLGIVVGILLASTPGLLAQAMPKGSGPLEITGPVRVIDGDTLEVYVNGRQMGIGILGIKAPRANTPCGRLAAQLMQQLVTVVDGLNLPVLLRFEEDEDQTFDSRKRRMYYLKLPGGVSAAAALVRAGLAEPDGTGGERDDLAFWARLVPRCAG